MGGGRANKPGAMCGCSGVCGVGIVLKALDLPGSHPLPLSPATYRHPILQLSPPTTFPPPAHNTSPPHTHSHLPHTHTPQAFKEGDVRFLLATDVAARGLDIAGLPYVVNLTLPDRAEDYIHRCGGAVRCGAALWGC